MWTLSPSPPFTHTHQRWFCFSQNWFSASPIAIWWLLGAAVRMYFFLVLVRFQKRRPTPKVSYVLVRVDSLHCQWWEGSWSQLHWTNIMFWQMQKHQSDPQGGSCVSQRLLSGIPMVICESIAVSYNTENRCRIFPQNSCELEKVSVLSCMFVYTILFCDSEALLAHTSQTFWNL